MKIHLVFATLLCILSVAFAWTKEDHEIFDLVSAIEAAEGKGTTFYSWLGISHKANNAEIGKAYKKRSMQLHPDKNPGVKGIQERFARLGVVATILRDAEGRKRYDFFYKNGVPRWRGTGYYYSRYRPGLISVLAFLTILTSFFQYVAQRIQYKQDVARIEMFVSKARAAAWGPKMIPNPTPRKVRVAVGDRAGEDALDVLVDGEKVFLLGGDEPALLDSSVPTKPSIMNTWAVILARNLYHKALPKQPSNSGASATAPEAEAALTSGGEDTDAAEATDGRAGTPGSRKGTPGASKVGARRRNVPTKKR
ncbi:hypothetical protein FRB99_005828 [Tulasnella sp. 403]|nr:hypothetical protein FRB99_005828 [Tulasnella sp. 403]